MRLKKSWEKIKLLLMMALLVGVMVGSHKLGEYLYAYADRESMETAGSTLSGDGQNSGEAKSENESGDGNAGTVLIVVDSGHGGGDPGKVGINGALEKDVNLKISKKVEKLLKKNNIQVVMTREDEKGLADSKVEDMKTRVSIINEKKPTLAVSIHQNSYGQESIHGAQVFYYSHSKEGEKAAKIMQEALLTADSENKRQAKANDTYYMLKRTEVPVIIVECGFLSNQKEAEKLVTEEYQEKIAEAVCEGVLGYIKN